MSTAGVVNPNSSSQQFSEGDVFAVRLEIHRPPCWAVGVVSRVSIRWPHLILAHFFPLLWKQRPSLIQVPPLSAQDSVLVCRVSDLALRAGAWPIVSTLPGWSAAQWPMPHFLVPPHRPGQLWREETYYEHDPGHRKRSIAVGEPTWPRPLPDGATVTPDLAVRRLIKSLEKRPSAGQEWLRSELTHADRVA